MFGKKYEAHMTAYRENNAIAMQHLRNATAQHDGGSFALDFEAWELYKKYSKEANKHHGIASMIATKAIKKHQQIAETG